MGYFISPNTLRRAMDDDLDIVLISSFSKCDEALDRLSQGIVFGVDCEWDIVKKGGVEIPDLLQIATSDGFCALFRLNLMKSVPPGVQKLLEDPKYVKVGVGIKEDTKRLLDFYGVDTKSVVDLRHIADELGLDPRGLSHLSDSVLGVPCKKYSYRSQFHKWSGTLTKAQIRYAARDAVNAVRIFDKLRMEWVGQRKDWGDQWKEWGEDTYHQNTVGLWGKYLGRNFHYNFSRFYIKEIVDSMLSMSSLSMSIT